MISRVSDGVACVDGPLDARGKVRILTGGSIAIMCPALWTRHHDRWPRWYPRSKPEHMGGFESQCTKQVLWIVGSTERADRLLQHRSASASGRRLRGMREARPDRHLIQLFHPGIDA
jgi:hypothetical protein